MPIKDELNNEPQVAIREDGVKVIKVPQPDLELTKKEIEIKLEMAEMMLQSAQIELMGKQKEVDDLKAKLELIK